MSLHHLAQHLGIKPINDRFRGMVHDFNDLPAIHADALLHAFQQVGLEIFLFSPLLAFAIESHIERSIR